MIKIIVPVLIVIGTAVLVWVFSKQVVELKSKVSDLENQKRTIENKIQFYNDRADKLASLLEAEEKRTKELIQDLAVKRQRAIDGYDAEVETIKADYLSRKSMFTTAIQEWEEAYNGLLSPFKQLQSETHNCLVLSPEDLADIKFLFSEVMPLMRNKEVVPKIVWSTFVKKPLDELLERIGAKEESGIYKITNLKDKKCYIGQASNLKRRLTDHFKSVCGISSVLDQKIHEVIRKEGIENFEVAIICYCPKEQLNSKEAFYIKEFQSSQWGYNMTAGNWSDELWTK